MARFLYCLAGEKLSEMFDLAGVDMQAENLCDNLIEDVEERMEDNASGENSFDYVEDNIKIALRESGLPFAAVFKGSYLYAVVTRDHTSFFEKL